MIWSHVSTRKDWKNMAAEKNFEHQVERWFESIGIYPAGCPKQKMTVDPIGWYFKVFGGGFQKSGIPDLIVNAHGLFLAVELKAETGRPSALQRINVNRIRETDGNACFLYPSGFERFKKDLLNLLDDIGDIKLIYKKG